MGPYSKQWSLVSKFEYVFFLKKNLFNEENSYRILIQLIDFLKSNFHALKECKKL